jgi:hypothetical protein
VQLRSRLLDGRGLLRGRELAALVGWLHPWMVLALPDRLVLADKPGLGYLGLMQFTARAVSAFSAGATVLRTA